MSSETLSRKSNHSSNPGDRQTARLVGYFDRLAASGFFGKVLVSFQNGKVHDLKIEQTKKLDEL